MYVGGEHTYVPQEKPRVGVDEGRKGGDQAGRQYGVLGDEVNRIGVRVQCVQELGWLKMWR